MYNQKSFYKEINIARSRGRTFLSNIVYATEEDIKKSEESHNNGKCDLTVLEYKKGWLCDYVCCGICDKLMCNI